MLEEIQHSSSETYSESEETVTPNQTKSDVDPTEKLVNNITENIDFNKSPVDLPEGVQNKTYIDDEGQEYEQIAEDSFLSTDSSIDGEPEFEVPVKDLIKDAIEIIEHLNLQVTADLNLLLLRFRLIYDRYDTSYDRRASADADATTTN